MANLIVRVLLALALAVGVVAGVSFYMGWFPFFSSDSDGKNAPVTVSVDKDQIQKDKDKTVDNVKDLGQPAKDKVETATQKGQD